MELKESFDLAPKCYDAARPSYPDEVIDWIIQKTGVTVADSLLEIGPGTGQATIKFAERGFHIHCIERGENLARLLLHKCERYPVTVDISSFEDWKPQDSFSTSLIFCASAFHWIDKNIRYQKCHELLSDGGYLVLLWNIIPDTQPLPLQKAYELVWKYYPEKRRAQKPKADVIRETKLEIANSGLFKLQDFLDYPWSLPQTRERIAQGLFSMSLYLSLDDEKQKEISAQVTELFQDLDETVNTKIFTTVYIAKKVRSDRV